MPRSTSKSSQRQRPSCPNSASGWYCRVGRRIDFGDRHDAVAKLVAEERVGPVIAGVPETQAFQLVDGFAEPVGQPGENGITDGIDGREIAAGFDPERLFPERTGRLALDVDLDVLSEAGRAAVGEPLEVGGTL